MDKRVIDVACGSKMFWFGKENPDVEFCDNRTVPYHEYYTNRYIQRCRLRMDSSSWLYSIHRTSHGQEIKAGWRLNMDA